MNRARADQALNASVLDRLIGDGAGRSNGAPRLAELKRAVKRDLEMLLNSRARCLRPPADLTEIPHSVMSYGIPDFTGLDLATEARRDDLVRRIEAVIRRFEPRFIEVSVRRLDNADPHDRTLRLRIEALMHASPAPEPLVLSSQFDPTSASFNVSGGGDV